MAGGRFFLRVSALLLPLGAFIAAGATAGHAADAPEAAAPAIVPIPPPSTALPDIAPSAGAPEVPPDAAAPVIAVPAPATPVGPAIAPPHVRMPAPVLAVPKIAPPAAATPEAVAIAAALQGGEPLVLAGRALDKPTLNAIYQARGYQPVWSEPRQQSYRRAVAEAASQGLDPASFSVAAAQPVARELLLSDAFLRYASALARGRVDPKDFETDWRIDQPVFDAGKVFNAAMNGDIAVTLAALAPHEPEYERLRAALRRYAALDQKAWHVLFSPVAVQLGDRGDIVKALRDRLIAEGYLDAAVTPDDPTFFDQTLSAAVSKFQTTHGLPVDGSVGRLTLAALNVSPALRTRQIRWNLERWRSLPRIDAATRIEVNVAAAQAVLFEGGEPIRTMRAIVGAAVHPTPVLRARIASVLLNPPWIVPASIIQKEIRPMLKRDPKYLTRFGFAYWDVRGGKELVQVPGPTNSLGQVKFEMPNPDDVYMHDTPERRLFALSRRYISHGCIRVEDPRGLAQVLLDSGQWSRDAIDAAIATGQTQSIPLHRSLPVYALYWTAFVDPDGTVEFRDDVYGRDRRLAEALAARAAAEHLAASQANKGSSG